jgi:F-type H+-transporting ATPase subunit b
MLLLATLASWAGFLLLVQPVLASEGSEDKWGAWLTIGRFFNLAVVVGLLVYVARKPLANFYASRSGFIKEQLAEAQRARQEAEAKLSEMEMRMNRLNEEIEAIKLEAEIDARAEHDRLVAAAERDAAKIVERARQEIDGMTRAAHLELKSYVAELSVKMAEEKIRSEITGTDQSRLFSDFIGDLGGKA